MKTTRDLTPSQIETMRAIRNTSGGRIHDSSLRSLRAKGLIGEGRLLALTPAGDAALVDTLDAIERSVREARWQEAKLARENAAAAALGVEPGHNPYLRAALDGMSDGDLLELLTFATGSDADVIRSAMATRR